MRNAGQLVIVSVIVLWGLGTVVAQGQEVPDGEQASGPETVGPWGATLQYDYDRVSSGRLDWRAWMLRVRRTIGDGTLAVTSVRQNRFGRADLGWRLDVWYDLWTDAWGHMRVGLGAKTDVYPRRTVQGGVHQGIGAWEGAVTYTWRRYPTEDVHLFRPEVARYLGQWYLRTFAFIVPQSSAWAVNAGVAARRFLKPPRSYVELRVGAGRGVELVRPDTPLRTVRTYFAALRLQRFLTPQFGVAVGVRYNNDGVYRRAGTTLGLLVRW